MELQLLFILELKLIEITFTNDIYLVSFEFDKVYLTTKRHLDAEQTVYSHANTLRYIFSNITAFTTYGDISATMKTDVNF